MALRVCQTIPQTLLIEGLTFDEGCPYIVDMPEQIRFANFLEEEIGGV